MSTIAASKIVGVSLLHAESHGARARASAHPLAATIGETAIPSGKLLSFSQLLRLDDEIFHDCILLNYLSAEYLKSDI